MEIVKDQEQSTPAVAQYDPNKRYRWTPEDQFVMSGSDFGILLNALRSLLATPEAQRILLADKANDVVESTLAKAVASGVVKEAEEDSSSL
jgi:hypothetical protein